MKKRILSLMSIIVILVCSFTACNSKSAVDDITITSDVSKIGSGKTSFAFVVVDADGSNEAFNISTNQKTVGEALKENNLISGEEGEFGIYVKTVNGITYDYDKDGKYWAFYVDGQYAPSGVDTTEINSESTYMFKAE